MLLLRVCLLSLNEDIPTFHLTLKFHLITLCFSGENSENAFRCFVLVLKSSLVSQGKVHW